MSFVNNRGFDINIKVFGDKELTRAYQRLAVKSKTRMIQNSAVTSLRPIAKTAKQNLKSRTKKGTGNLYKSIQVSRQDKFMIGAFVKARRVRGRYFGHTSHLIDLGTKERTTGSGRRTGKVKATKFWSDAVLSNERQVDDRFNLELNKNMNNYIKKYLAKKGARR